MAGLKRTAETQLTKEHVNDDDEVIEIAPSEGFKRADKSVLASRPMKGLPKRITPIATTGNVPSSNNFDFGPTTKTFAPSGSPFAFNPSAPSPAVTQPVASSSPFNFSSPAVSSTATNTTKQLASILSSAPQPNGVHAALSVEKRSVSVKDDTELKYYATLRGLNESFRKQIESKMEEDPCFDLSVYMDQYREFRVEVEGKFKDKREPERATLVNGSSSPPSSDSNAVSAPAPTTKTLSMPAPPKAFSGFGTPTPIASSSTSTPPSGGFKPNFAAMPSTTPSLFTFGSSKPAEEKDKLVVSSTSGTDLKPSPFGITAGPSKPSPFGAVSSSSSPFGTTSTSTTEKSASSFGSGSGFGATSNLGRSSTFSATTAGPSNPFASSSAGSSTLLPAFGSTGGSSSSGFSFGGVKSSSSFSGTSSSLFGVKPASEESKEADGATTTDQPVASSSKLTSGSSLGSTSGSSGFSFGSSSATTVSSGQDVANTSAKPSAPASVTSGVESRDDTPVPGEGGEASTEAAKPQKVIGENQNDVEGEGEEDEETLFTTRGKIFRFGRKDDKPAWIEVGVGMIRLKKKKEDDTIVRLLSRNSANGKIMMNFNIYPGFKISYTKTILNFVGHDDSGQSITYRVRVKDEANAVEFHDAVESATPPLEA